MATFLALSRVQPVKIKTPGRLGYLKPLSRLPRRN